MTISVSADSNLGRRSPLRETLRGIAAVLGLALLFLALGTGYGLYRFGSTSAALSYLQGERILVDRSFKSIAMARPGSEVVVHYTLANHSARPVSFVGMTSSCTCTRVDSHPEILAPSETRVITANIRIAEDRDAPVAGTVLLYTDSPESPKILLAYRVSLTTGPPRQGR
jgi:hypothetical protein